MRPTIVTSIHNIGLGRVAVLLCFGSWLMWCALIRWQLPFARNMGCASRPGGRCAQATARALVPLRILTQRSLF